MPSALRTPWGALRGHPSMVTVCATRATEPTASTRPSHSRSAPPGHHACPGRGFSTRVSGSSTVATTPVRSRDGDRRARFVAHLPRSVDDASRDGAEVRHQCLAVLRTAAGVLGHVPAGRLGLRAAGALPVAPIARVG
jgi:hypothetical protein